MSSVSTNDDRGVGKDRADRVLASQMSVRYGRFDDFEEEEDDDEDDNDDDDRDNDAEVTASVITKSVAEVRTSQETEKRSGEKVSSIDSLAAATGTVTPVSISIPGSGKEEAEAKPLRDQADEKQSLISRIISTPPRKSSKVGIEPPSHSQSPQTPQQEGVGVADADADADADDAKAKRMKNLIRLLHSVSPASAAPLIEKHIPNDHVLLQRMASRTNNRESSKSKSHEARTSPDGSSEKKNPEGHPSEGPLFNTQSQPPDDETEKMKVLPFDSESSNSDSSSENGDACADNKPERDTGEVDGKGDPSSSMKSLFTNSFVDRLVRPSILTASGLLNMKPRNSISHVADIAGMAVGAHRMQKRVAVRRSSISAAEISKKLAQTAAGKKFFGNIDDDAVVDVKEYEDGVNAMALLNALMLTIPYQLLSSLSKSSHPLLWYFNVNTCF